MTEKRSITYAFRRPRFPIICQIDGNLIGARDSAEFRRRLARFDLPNVKEFQGIDASGGKWIFLPDEMIVAPAFMAMPARKIDVVQLFNESQAAKLAGLHYPERVINNRRLDRIIQDLVNILPPRMKLQRPPS